MSEPNVARDADRWRLWQLANAHSSRRDATRARIALAVLLTAAAAWLGLQILSMPV